MAHIYPCRQDLDETRVHGLIMSLFFAISEWAHIDRFHGVNAAELPPDPFPLSAVTSQNSILLSPKKN